jgi:hypothetical protein
MPAFQRYSPVARYVRAVAASGFSVERRRGPLDAERRAAADVAERRRRAGRRDADRHDEARPRRLDALADRALERVRARDDVVGRERAEDDVPVPLLEDRRREPDGRHGVARRGLGDDDVVRQLRELLLRGCDVRAPRDEDDVPPTGQRLEPVHGRLEQRAAGAREVVQELGRARA